MNWGDRFEIWFYSHAAHPERITESDRNQLRFITKKMPGFLLMIAIYSAVVGVYVYLYNKYGIERVVILLLCQITLTIGNGFNDLKKILKENSPH